MHIVYVTCATESDLFLEMTAVAVASCRLTNPSAKVTLVVDRSTERVSSAASSYLRGHADRLLTVDAPGASPAERSRYLKCNLRELVAGRFLFLDSDTLIFRDLSKIGALDCDIAAAPDLNEQGREYLCKSGAFGHFSPVGWEMPETTYLNAGAIFYSDTLASYEVGRNYAKSWQEYRGVTGRFNDQPAFNRALYTSRARVECLPLAYNAQVLMNPMTARGAAIVHYFSADFTGRNDTIAHVLAKELQATGVLKQGRLSEKILAGDPWTTVDTFKKAIAAKNPVLPIARIIKQLFLGSAC
jgi:hypothetical protein